MTLSDKEYKRRWELVEYKGKKFIDYKESNSSDNQENQFAHNENVPEYFTSKGERVRSKFEILISAALMSGLAQCFIGSILECSKLQRELKK